jgi:hypothetical protein
MKTFTAEIAENAEKSVVFAVAPAKAGVQKTLVSHVVSFEAVFLSAPSAVNLLSS